MTYGGVVTKTSSPTDERHLRPAGRATRAAIETAARELFAERGFDGASVRGIATRAGVDPALVIRHFGSKEALFLRCVDTSLGISAVVDGPIENLGRRLVAYFLAGGERGMRQRYLAITQAAHLDQVREEMVRHTAEKYVAPLVPRLTGDRRELRVGLVVAQIAGLLNVLYLQEDPALTRADPDDLVELYGDTIQRLLTP